MGEREILWTVHTNTDLTEGRGREYVKHFCKLQATAIRLAERETHMPRKSAKTAPVEEAIVAYKGFDKNLVCTPAGNPFQYELGKTYDNGGQPVRRCAAAGGFHSCEMPQDMFTYYGPATSRYATTTPHGDTARDEHGDSKIASAKITINVELTLGDIARRAVAWVAEKAKLQGNGQYAAGYGGHASAAGGGGHASAAGDGGHASAAGDYGHASAAGTRGHASTKGKNAIAHAAGKNGTATAEAGGAISLAAYDDNWNLVAVRSSLVGQNGVEAGKTYRLTTAGKFEEVVKS